jgi:hypothetical protein
MDRLRQTVTAWLASLQTSSGTYSFPPPSPKKFLHSFLGCLKNTRSRFKSFYFFRKKLRSLEGFDQMSAFWSMFWFKPFRNFLRKIAIFRKFDHWSEILSMSAGRPLSQGVCPPLLSAQYDEKKNSGQQRFYTQPHNFFIRLSQLCTYVYEFFLSLLSGLLGILLMALSGLRTLTVRIADRLSFSTSRQYSRALKQKVKFSLATGSIPGPLIESKIQSRNGQYSRALKRH